MSWLRWLWCWNDATVDAPSAPEPARAVVPEVPDGTLLMPSPGAVELGDGGPYARSEDHVWDELLRIDQLVRAQTLRWRWTIAAGKPEDWWGMVHVGDGEVESYLQSPVTPRQQLPADLEQALAGYWGGAERLALAIGGRREQSDGVCLRLERLRRLFRLSDLERDILLVCLLPELDGRYRRLFGYLQDDASRTRPTVELVLQILHPLILRRPETGRTAFEGGAPLIAQRLLHLDGDAGADEPLPMRRVRLDDRIAGYLLGSNRPDPRLGGVLTCAEGSVGWEQVIAEPERVAQLQGLAAWWGRRRADGAGAAVFLAGPSGSGRLNAARAVCSATGTPLLLVDAASALRASQGWEQTVELCVREAELQEAALYWAACERVFDREQPPHRWDYLVAAVERHHGLTFLAADTAWDPTGRFRTTPFVRFDFPMPGYPVRLRLWELHLPLDQEFAAPAPRRSELAEALANGFQLTEGQIVDAVASARWQAARRDPAAPRLTADDLFEGSRRQSGRRLTSFARRIEPRTELKFADLVLPPANLRQLDELRARIRYRSRVYSGLGLDRRLTLGKGLIALFTGSSGTGKTMAAELLAREQGVDLYKVDLSAVTSKWVGETEKNLSRVFAEAEDANAIIFFDEADALFGKRAEVKEAQDRWANMEVNYLLQRVEEYAGVVILASNLRQNIDDAFMRRINTLVEFPFPDPAARARILRGLFPAGVTRPPDDALRALADRFKLSGGSLKNVVVDACFRALADGADPPLVTMRHLVVAVAREYEKTGVPITIGDFGDSYAWVQDDVLYAVRTAEIP